MVQEGVTLSLFINNEIDYHGVYQAKLVYNGEIIESNNILLQRIRNSV